MFKVTVRDHFMVAHSFSGEVFGPAQALHGATFVADATFQSIDLDENGIVIDIGLASQQLHEVVAALSYRNLDDVPEFAGMNTTTEVLARWIADQLVERLRSGSLGKNQVSRVVVTLKESHIASASYERSV